MNAKNENNQNVDWWFIYKTPANAGTPDNKGDQYFYFDANSTRLKRSGNSLSQQQGALYHTMSGAFNSQDPDMGFITWNDQHTENQSNPGHGPGNGIIFFNKANNSASLLVHSVPGFPEQGQYMLPDEELQYAQVFFCVTLGGYAGANLLARQMMQQQHPQVLQHSSHLPKSIDKDEALAQLFYGMLFPSSQKTSELNFSSHANTPFKIIAKSDQWQGDFWQHLVAQKLNVSLDSAYRSQPASGFSAPETQNTTNEISFDATGGQSYAWPFSLDRSNWAVASGDHDQPWVCIGDLSRASSQNNLGGGAICFEEETLCKALNNALQAANYSTSNNQGPYTNILNQDHQAPADNFDTQQGYLPQGPAGTQPTAPQSPTQAITPQQDYSPQGPQGPMTPEPQYSNSGAPYYPDQQPNPAPANAILQQPFEQSNQGANNQNQLLQGNTSYGNEQSGNQQNQPGVGNFDQLYN